MTDFLVNVGFGLGALVVLALQVLAYLVIRHAFEQWRDRRADRQRPLAPIYPIEMQRRRRAL